MAMNTYTKTLSELNAKNQSLKDELYKIEVGLGHKLIENENTEIDENLKSEYEVLKTNLDEKKQDLEILNNLETKIDDSEKEISEEKKKTHEAEKNLDSLLLELGTNLYSNYNKDFASVWGLHYDEINQLNQNIEDLTQQKETLKEEMEKQGFFTKLMTQTKVAGLNVSISSQNRKREDMLKRVAKLCFDNEVVTQENGGEVFVECSNLKVSIDDSNERIKFLQEEIVNARNKVGEMEKSHRLKQGIQDFSDSLDEVANKIGHSYGKFYVTRDAEILMDFPELFKVELNSVLEYKKQLKIVNREFDIVSLSGQIEAAEKTIKSKNDELDSNKKKIEDLQKINIEILKQIEEVEKAKIELIEKRSTLEAEAENDK